MLNETHILLGTLVATLAGLVGNAAELAKATTDQPVLIDDSFETNPMPGPLIEWGIRNEWNYKATQLTWYIHNLPGYAWDSTVAHTGTHSVRLGGVSGHNFIVHNLFPVEAGETYELTAWVKTQDAVNAEIYPELQFFENETNVTEIVGGAINDRGNIVALSGSHDWTQVVARGVVPGKATALMAALVSRNNTAGTAWYDDMKLRRLSTDEAKLPPAIKPMTPPMAGRAVAAVNATPAAAAIPAPPAVPIVIPEYALPISESFETNPVPEKLVEWGERNSWSEKSRQRPWYVHNAGGYSWDNTVAHSGKSSIKLSKANGHCFLAHNLIRVKPGQAFQVSAWAKTEHANGETYPAIQFFKDETGENGLWPPAQGGSPYSYAMWLNEPLKGTCDWKQVVVRATVPLGVVAMAVEFVANSNTEGSSWFDDITIAQLPESEARGELNLHPPAQDRVLTPNDYVNVKDGHLWYQGKRFRAWSAQGGISGPTYGDIDRELGRFLDHGFNAYRTLVWDPEISDTVKGDLSPQDKHDYLMAAIGTRGAFVWSDLLNSCHIKPEQVGAIDDPATAEAWSAAVKQMAGDQNYVSIRACLPSVFDPRVKQLYHQYIKKVLAHRNTYNGLTYAEDPTYFTWELTNEEWWIMRVIWGGHLSLPRFFQEQFYRAWNDWLIKKYKTDKGLVAAWSDVLDGESLEKKSVLFMPLMAENDASGMATSMGLGVHATKAKYTPADFPKQRGNDVLQFMVESVRSAKAEAAAVFKSQGKPGLGCQVVPLLYDTGYSGSPLTLYVQSGGDATAVCVYQDMSSHDANAPTFPFASALRSPPQINGWIDARKVDGKPGYIYEFMTFNPQKYRLEAPYRLLANAAIHDLDVVSWHYYGHPIPSHWLDQSYSSHPLEYMNGGRNWDGVMMRTDEVLMSAVRVCGEIFKHGYLHAAKAPTVVTLGRDSMFDFNKVEGDSARGDAPDRTVYHHGMVWRFDPARKEDRTEGALIDQARARMEAVHSPTDQISFRWQEGRMVVDDSKVKLLLGFGDEKHAFADGVSISNISVNHPKNLSFVIPGERYVGISLASTDDQPLATSRRILLSAMSTSANTGLAIDLKRMAEDKDYCFGLARAVINPGGMPVLVARVGATLAAPWLNGRGFRFLDFDGKTITEGNITDGALTIPSDKAIYVVEITW